MCFWVSYAPTCPLDALLGPQSQDMKHLVEMLEWGDSLAPCPHPTTSACILLPLYCHIKPSLWWWGQLVKGLWIVRWIQKSWKRKETNPKCVPVESWRTEGSKELKCAFLKENIVLLSCSRSKTRYCLMVLIEFFSQKLNKRQSRPQGQCYRRFGHSKLLELL